MLNVFICEDNERQRKDIELVVEKYIIKEDVDVQLTLSTGSPIDVLDYLEKHPNTKGIYFLDVDLQHRINGIELAAMIRGIDLWGTLVFITTHEELAHLVFEYKVEALDYIIKDQIDLIEQRVVECLQTGYMHFLDSSVTKRELYSVKSGDQIWNIPLDEVLFFETDLSMRHRIILQTINSRINFRGSISKIATENSKFYLCHKSVVVNTNNIRHIDTALSKAELVNGDFVTIARRKMPELLARLNTLNG